MKKYNIYLFALIALAVVGLSACQRQADEAATTPDTEMVSVRFNAFLKEGDRVVPFDIASRSVPDATLSNGFYLYGHAHKLPFATTSGNSYVPIFENVKVNSDGTYSVPKFWFDSKTHPYCSFQAYSATGKTGPVAPQSVTVGSQPYVSSTMANDDIDILGAGTFDIKLSDEIPTVNLYFEHRLAKLTMRAQRINSGGPALYNVNLSYSLSATYESTMKWGIVSFTPGSNVTMGFGSYDIVASIPSSDMSPVDINNFTFVPQSIAAGTVVTMTYTLEPGAVTTANPKYTLTTILPAFTLEAGKQTVIVIGHIVEVDQIVVQSVTLTDWTTRALDVPEYGGPTYDCFAMPIPGYLTTYVGLVDNVAIGWDAAKVNCAAWGGRLPTKDELVAMYANRAQYGTFLNGLYWSSENTAYPFVKNMVTGDENYGNKANPWNVRCVKDGK